jgi:hypothetical protein
MRALAATLLALLVTAAPSAARAAAPHVTVIGDSVMAEVSWNDPAQILAHGLDVRWEVAVCRTIDGVSCPFDGARPPTLLDLVRTDGAGLAPTAVVELGYNDPPDTFARAVDEAVWALAGVGVTRVVWLTLHEALPQYAAMNADLVAAEQRHPELEVADWNAVARGHPDWFQDDGIHLLPAGAAALASFVDEVLTQPPAKATAAAGSAESQDELRVVGHLVRRPRRVPGELGVDVLDAG